MLRCLVLVVQIAANALLSLPHCTRTNVVSGQIQSVQLDSATATVTISSSVQSSLSMGETVCFFVQVEDSSDLNNTDKYNASLMHAIHYERTHQLYPVREQYTFAIPQLKSECLCDCPGGDDHCSVGYAHKNCSTNEEYCIRTYHPHQPSIGCGLPGEADQCCEIKTKAHNDWRFLAVYLGQPLAIATFRYYMLKRQNHRWETIENEVFEALTNQAQKVRIAKGTAEVQLNGAKANWQLKEGMYFYKLEEEAIQLRHGVPVNRFHEYSVNKLGWFRWNEKERRWNVRNGKTKLRAAHFLHTINCQSQEYAETYNADYYAAATSAKNEQQLSYFLGHAVQNAETWIGDVKLVDHNGASRQISVRQVDSSPIQLTISFNGTAGFTLYHHGSDLTDFVGLIQMDSNSNRYLNITLLKAKGTLAGEMFCSNTEERMELAFSVYVSAERLVNASMLIGVPASINETKWVCLQPHENREMRKCRWVSYSTEPLPSIELPHSWVQAQGHCEDCNKVTPTNFLSYLNPANWINGVNGWPEAVAVGVEVVFYALVIIIAIAICRRFICPVIKWSICSSNKKEKAPA